MKMQRTEKTDMCRAASARRQQAAPKSCHADPFTAKTLDLTRSTVELQESCRSEGQVQTTYVYRCLISISTPELGY